MPINKPRPTYLQRIKEVEKRLGSGNLAGLNAEQLVRYQLMNELEGEPVTGLAIARRNSRIMRRDMARYLKDRSQYTQSLGAASGYKAKMDMIAAKESRGTLDRVYIYGSGWQWAELSSSMSPLPDTSSHPKDTVPNQIEEIYRYLRQADANALLSIFKKIDKTKDKAELTKLYAQVDNFDSHIRPIIADIDAGFGDPSATYYLACKMIQAGASCIQLENQVSDQKQCGHQDGKVTCPREEYLAKLRAVRLAFESQGVPEGVIVARTDSLGAGLTQNLAPSDSKYAEDYNKWLDMEPVTKANPADKNDVLMERDGKLMKLKRLPSGLFEFKKGTGSDRAVEDMIFAFKEAGADLGWIETGAADLKEITALTTAVRKKVPNFMLAYNNSPSFAWTLNARQLILKAWTEAGNKEAKNYPTDASIGDAKYADTKLGKAAHDYIADFQKNVAKDACVFHNLITLPEHHVTGLRSQQLARSYFGERGMDAYVSLVQDPEFEGGYSAVVKHQWASGSDLTDHVKQATVGENANIAAGKHNTQNQFDALLEVSKKRK